MNDIVSYACVDGVATISMNDGRVNVMSTTMLKALDAALDRAEADKAIVVLRSTREGIFSAGFDLKIFAANDAEKSVEMVKAGAELALRLLSHPYPTIGVMQGHAFPMGTFLLLGCDVRIAEAGAHKMGLNEVAIGIVAPGFAMELARSRMHPAYLNRTVVLGELFEPNTAVKAGLLDMVVPAAELDGTLKGVIEGVSAIHMPSHASAKKKLRKPVMDIMRELIDRELNMEAYSKRPSSGSDVVLPGK